jgi:hypothetical protein
VACRGSLLRAAPLVKYQPQSFPILHPLPQICLLDDGCPRIGGLKYLNAWMFPLDARLEVLTAAKTPDQEDALMMGQYGNLNQMAPQRRTVTPPSGRLILTDFTWSSIRRRISVMRGAKMAFRSLLLQFQQAWSPVLVHNVLTRSSSSNWPRARDQGRRPRRP